MIDQLKFFIEQVKSKNSRCSRPVKCCAIIITLPAILLGMLFVGVAKGLRYLEHHIITFIKFVWK